MKALILNLGETKAEEKKALLSVCRSLKHGKIGVVPTDTLYGLVGLAFNRKTVEKIYRLRRRTPLKPFIILISSIHDLAQFDVELEPAAAKLLAKVWPGKVSVVLSCHSKDLDYLHRKTQTLAFRLPDDHKLRSLLKQTGPLVAPSVNFEGQSPALTIAEAQNYFGDKIDFYLDCGKRVSEPSTLIKIENKKAVILRQGAAKV